MKKWMVAFCVGALSLNAYALRIKDVAQFEGIRSNGLMGYGLVVGLDGTGDQTTQSPFTAQAMNTMLAQMGVNLPAGVASQTKNTAAVMLTAQLPAFARPGESLDVTVASLGNAKSLKGGILLMTPLKGPDGQIYAVAQGNVLILNSGKSNPVPLNAGRIPEGAKVERAAPTASDEDNPALILNAPDFSVAEQVETKINQLFGEGYATALDSKRIMLKKTGSNGLPAVKIAQKIENIELDEPKYAAKVVINSKTGSVIMGQNISIGECAISQNGLNVTIGVANPQADGKSANQPNNAASGASVVYIKKQPSLADVVKTLNAMGVGTNDLIAIIQAMKNSGALHADLEVL